MVYFILFSSTLKYLSLAHDMLRIINTATEKILLCLQRRVYRITFLSVEIRSLNLIDLNNFNKLLPLPEFTNSLSVQMQVFALLSVLFYIVLYCF